MFRTVPLSIIRSFSLYTQQWYVSYQLADSCKQDQDGTGADPPLPCHPPSYWLRLLSSQNFSRINTPTFSKFVILHTYPPVKMEQSVPKRRHIKFRRRGITQKKAHNMLILIFYSVYAIYIVLCLGAPQNI